MFKSKRMPYACMVFLSLLFVVAQSLMGQTAATGALSGTVTDPSGAVIANATVTIVSIETGQTRRVMTGMDGSYKAGLLPPGTYRIKFEVAGFQSVEVPSITVHVTETPVLNQVMSVGAQSQQVEVQGEAVEEVQTSNATVGTLVSGKTIADFPLTSRNYTNILGLSAGSNTGVNNAAALGKGTQNIAVNGSSTTQNNFQMDGVSMNDPSSNGTASESGYNAGVGIANPDAIEEFKIQTSLVDAGYGRKPGANVNVVTKSGTNAFHGTLFEFFRNTALNANDFFRNQSYIGTTPNNSRQVLNQNQFGGVIGGPIKKDKFFFFASYQESRQKNGVATQGSSAPTLLPIPTGDRSNTATFRAALGAVFCPTVAQGGTCPVASGGKTSNGGQQVLPDGSNINQVAINLLQLKTPDGSYYIPSSGTAGNLPTTLTIPATYSEHQALGNLDYVINSKNTLSWKWFFGEDPTQAPFGCTATVALGTPPGICLPYTAGATNYENQSALLKLTSIVSSSMVNEARISIQHNKGQVTNQVPFTNSQVGVASILPSIGALDQFNVSGLFSIGTTTSVGGSYKNSSGFEVADTISWTHGKHTVRSGFEIELDQINAGLPGNSVGVQDFQTFQDFLLGLPGCSSAQILAGCSASNIFPGTNGTTTSNITDTGIQASVAQPSGLRVDFLTRSGSAFVQDDIKFTPRFTLNLGMRWEYNGLVKSKYGFLTDVWPSLINTVPIPGTSAATGTLAGFVVPSNYNPALNPAPPVGGLFQSNHTVGSRNNVPLDDFAPRVGLAWQPTSSDRFVVRGGFGYYYDRLTTASAPAVFYIQQPLTTLLSKKGAANSAATEAQPYAVTPLQWQPRFVNFATGATSNLSSYMLAENYLTPLVYEWNLNTQYEFLPTWVLELGYVGSRGIHQPILSTQLINQADLVGTPTGNNAPGIAAGLVTTNTASNAALRVPYLGFAPGGLLEASTNGDYKYNSLQGTVRKQISHGLTFQAAYTWSKSLTTGSLNVNNANNYGAQYGPNASYHPQRLTVNYSYDLPFGHLDGLMGKLVTGWALAGVTTVQDGTPLTVTDTRGGTIYGFGAGAGGETSTGQFCSGMGVANAANSGSVKQRLGGANGGQGWFNKSAFCTVPAYPTPIGDGSATGYGNAPLGIVLGPGQFNWDVSILKTTRVGGLREDATLQFRTEFFNAFNHAQFNNPAVLDASKSSFGAITSTSVNPRLIQFALKYSY